MYLVFTNRPVEDGEEPERFRAAKRVLSGDRETLTFYSVTPDPGEVSGTIQMYRDDGFLISEDNADGYERKIYEGGTLTLTNAPEPEPVEPDPGTDPEPSGEYVTYSELAAAIREGVNLV